MNGNWAPSVYLAAADAAGESGTGYKRKTPAGIYTSQATVSTSPVRHRKHAGKQTRCQVQMT